MQLPAHGVHERHVTWLCVGLRNKTQASMMPSCRGGGGVKLGYRAKVYAVHAHACGFSPQSRVGLIRHPQICVYVICPHVPAALRLLTRAASLHFMHQSVCESLH